MDIIRVIKEKGKTIQDVADALDKKRITVAKTIGGNPTVDTLRKIANVLECDITDFFRDEVSGEPIKKENTPHIICPKCGTKINIKVNTEE